MEVVDSTGMFNEGKRDYIVGDFVKSVDTLQQVCKYLSEKHGDCADELGEPYLYYGKALLELARMESGVLGNALDGVPEEEEQDEGDSDDAGIIEKQELTEAEKETISSNVFEALTTDRKDVCTDGKTTQDKAADAADVVEADEVVDVGDASATDVVEADEVVDVGDASATDAVDAAEVADASDAVEATADDEDAAADEDGEEDEAGAEDDEEDVSNLQLAWEVLDLARVIFTRTEPVLDVAHEPEHQKRRALRAADAHLALGEVALEKEEFTAAAEELRCCLRLQQANGLAREDRRLCETRYQLGVALLHARCTEEGCAELQEAARGLRFRQKELPADAAEVQELAELVAMIDGRVTDAREDQLDEDELRRTMREAFAGATVTGFGEQASGKSAGAAGESSSSSSAAVSDISHLIRKKRKPEDVAATAADVARNGASETSLGNCSKKARLDVGKATAVTATNGH